MSLKIKNAFSFNLTYACLRRDFQWCKGEGLDLYDGESTTKEKLDEEEDEDKEDRKKGKTGEKAKEKEEKVKGVARIWG